MIIKTKKILIKFCKIKSIITFLVMTLFFLNFCAFAEEAKTETPQKATPIYKNKSIQKTVPDATSNESTSKTQEPEQTPHQTVQPQKQDTPSPTVSEQQKKIENNTKKIDENPKPAENEQKQENKVTEDEKEKKEEVPKPPVSFPKKQEEEKYKLPSVSNDEIGAIKSTADTAAISPETNVFESIVKPLIAWGLILSGIILIFMVILKNRKIPRDFDTNSTNMKRRKVGKKYSYSKKSKF